MPMFPTRHFHRTGRWRTPPPTDVTAPVISSVAVSGITDAEATVGWDTDEPADGQVEWGLGAGTAVIAATAKIGGTSADVSIPKSIFPGLTAGDLVIIGMGASLSNGLLWSQAGSTTGWTLPSALNQDITGSAHYTAAIAYKRIADPGAEPVNWQFSRGSSQVPNWDCVLALVRASDASSVLDVAPTASHYAEVEDTHNVDPPDITTVTDGAIVFTFHFSAAQGNTPTFTPGPPAGFTLHQYGSQNWSFAVMASKVQASAGAVSVGPWTHAPADDSYDSQAMTIAVRPASTGSQYGNVTALDETPRTTHSHQLTGLPSGSTIHYRPRSTDAAGNEAIGSDDTFATLAGGAPGLFPTPTSTLVWNDSSLSQPGLGVEVQDPTFDGSITRVTGSHLQRNYYAEMAAWTRDSSMLCLFWGNNAAYLDGEYPWPVLFTRFGLPSPILSNVDPDIVWNMLDGGALRRYSISADAHISSRSFSGVASTALGLAEGALSLDDRWAAIATKSSSGGPWNGLIVYDTVANEDHRRVTFPQAIDSVAMSPSGKYVAVVFIGNNGTGQHRGTWIYEVTTDPDGIVPIRQVHIGTPHGMWGRSAALEDIVCFQGDGNPRPAIAHRASDGATTTFALIGDWSGHINMTAWDRPGYAVLSSNTTYNSGGVGSGQIIGAPTDGSNQYEVWCRDHTMQSGQVYDANPGPGYEGSAFAVPSPDGTMIVWGGRWGNTFPAPTSGSSVLAYVTRITP